MPDPDARTSGSLIGRPLARAALAACALAASATVAQPDAGSVGIAARTELHAIPSVTVSDAQFLKGERCGRTDDCNPIASAAPTCSG